MPKVAETRVPDAARSGRGGRRRDLRRAARACGRRGDAPADAARVPEDAGAAAAPPPAARAQRPRRFLRRALGADPEVLPGAVPGLLAGAVARGAHLSLLHGVRGGRAPAHTVGEHRRTAPPLRWRGPAHLARP